MSRILSWLDSLLSLTLLMSTTLATTIIYDLDGEHPNTRVAYTDMCGGAFSLASGGESGPHGWVNLMKCGKPYIDLIMTTYAATGVRDVEINVDYGERLGNDIIVSTTQAQRSTDTFDYAPKRGLMRVSLNRAYGGYARVRKIKNDGDCLVAIQALSPSTMKVLISIDTIDNKVEIV